MGTTTFTGAIRSESTFKTVSKDSTSGAITEVTTVGDGPVSLADSNVTLTNATHSGRILLVPDGGQDNTYTLPALLLDLCLGLFTQVVLLMQLMHLSSHPETLIFTLVV